MLSLRATGEGHISSITFRSGTVDAECRIRMDEPTRFVTAPEVVPNTLYDKTLFYRKLVELGVNGPFSGQVLATLGDQFTLDELQQAIRRGLHQNRPRHHEHESVSQGMVTLAKSNYEIGFSPISTSPSGSSSPRRRPSPTASRTPASSSSSTTTARHATTPRTPRSTAR